MAPTSHGVQPVINGCPGVVNGPLGVVQISLQLPGLTDQQVLHVYLPLLHHHHHHQAAKLLLDYLAKSLYCLLPILPCYMDMLHELHFAILPSCHASCHAIETCHMNCSVPKALVGGLVICSRFVHGSCFW